MHCGKYKMFISEELTRGTTKKGPIKWFGGTKLEIFPFDTITGEQKT